MLVGDLNVIHKPIDLAETVTPEIFVANRNRHWLDALLTPSQRNAELAPHYQVSPTDGSAGTMIDTFRHLHPTAVDSYSCWTSKSGARQTNFGQRIDYILCDERLTTDVISDSRISADVFGSDHCPVSTTFAGITLVPCAQLPLLCSANLPRFRNQSKITSFVMRTQKSAPKRTISSTLASKENQIIKSQTAATVTNGASACKVRKVEKPASALSNAWKAILRGPPKAPLCNGHKVACVLRTVIKQESANKGKSFWCCSKPNGLANNPESRCNHFEWASS